MTWNFLYDKSVVSRNTKPNSFMYTSIRMVLPVKKFSVESLVVCVLRRNPHVLKILKAATIIDIDFFSIIKLHFLISSRFEFFNRNFIWKLQSKGGGWSWKTTNIDLCKKILLVQISQKVFAQNLSWRLPKWCFSVSTVLICFMRVT